jgi:hypothetical protein
MRFEIIDFILYISPLSSLLNKSFNSLHLLEVVNFLYSGTEFFFVHRLIWRGPNSERKAATIQPDKYK